MAEAGKLIEQLDVPFLDVIEDVGSRREIFPKVVDGRDRLSGDPSHSVDEHDAVDQVLQLLTSI